MTRSGTREWYGKTSLRKKTGVRRSSTGECAWRTAMDEDFDRLRGGEEMREPLTRPGREYKPENRLAWIALFVLVAAVIGALWWWAPRTSESPAEAVGRVPAEG